MSGLRGCALSMLALLAVPAPSGAEPPLVHRIQAAYVSKFLRFVEWPGGPRGGAVFVVGVAGGAEFRDAMWSLEGYAVGDSAIRVRSIEGPADLDEIDVLVVGPPDAEQQTERYLAGARDRPILTVGDAPGFARAGGIIEFIVVEDTVRFEINVEAARRAGLKVSSRLLRLAVNVRRGS